MRNWTILRTPCCCTSSPIHSFITTAGIFTMAYFRAPSEEYLSQSPHGYQDEIRLQQFGLGETYNNQRPLSNPFESDPSIKNYADISYRETQDSFESDPADGLPDPSILRHSFRQRDQILKQLGSILGRFVLSIIFCGGIVGVFYYYDSLQQMTTGHKHYFNAIHTGLLLILGLNIVSAFKEMADIFRWKILASRQKKGGFSAKEIDLIFGISSYQKCVSLMFHWMKKRPKFFFPLTLWVILGIVGLRVVHSYCEPFTDQKTGHSGCSCRVRLNPQYR